MFFVNCMESYQLNIDTYQESWSGSSEQLDETDDDGGVTAIKRSSGRFEDTNSVEDHGIDSSELLEEHDAHQNTEWLQYGSSQ